jgi:hypothetical protein
MREPSSSGFGSSRTLKVTPVYAPPLIDHCLAALEADELRRRVQDRVRGGDGVAAERVLAAARKMTSALCCAPPPEGVQAAGTVMPAALKPAKNWSVVSMGKNGRRLTGRRPFLEAGFFLYAPRLPWTRTPGRVQKERLLVCTSMFTPLPFSIG